jgi:phosphoheptose isomerase
MQLLGGGTMLKELVTRYKQLSICQSDIQKSADALIACYNTGGKVLTCGNGGSCADCDQHFRQRKNVYAAAKVAKGLCLTVIGLTGKNNSNLSEIADICIRVPEVETFKVQELHLPIYHFLCAATEAHFFTE